MRRMELRQINESFFVFKFEGLLFEFLCDFFFAVDAFLYDFEQFSIFVAHDIFGDLGVVLLLLLLLLHLLFALGHDIILVCFFILVLFRGGFSFSLCDASELLLTLWHVPFRIIFVNKRGEMGRQSLDYKMFTFPTWYSLTFMSLLKLTES